MAAAHPINPEALAQRTASINDAIARVISAATTYAGTTEKSLDTGGSHTRLAATTSVAAHDALAVEVKKLLAEVLGPTGAVLDLLGSACRPAALRCLLELGVFAALLADGTSATADELAARLGVEVERTVRVDC